MTVIKPYINHNLTNGCQVHTQEGVLNLTFRNSPVCWGNQIADNLQLILDLVNNGFMKARVQRRIHELDQFEHWKHTWFVTEL